MVKIVRDIDRPKKFHIRLKNHLSKVFKSKNRPSEKSSVKIIKWERGQVVKKAKIEKKEKSSSFWNSQLISIIPTGIVAVAVMVACSTIAKNRNEEIMGVIEPTITPTVRASESTFQVVHSDVVISTPVNTPTPEPEVQKVEAAQVPIKPNWAGVARYSYYYPPLGGINCEEPCDIMANGEQWNKYQYRAVACPSVFPFETRIHAFGEVFYCKDRGEMIVFLDDGIPWIDFLRPNAQFPYGTLFYLEAYYPNTEK